MSVKMLFPFWFLWNILLVHCDDYDEVSSTTAVLPKLTSRAQTLNVIVGESVILPCEVDNLGPYVLIWKRGSSVLTAGEMKITMDKRANLVKGFNLEIRKVRPQDAGDYICQLSTSPPKEQTHTIKVLVPPTVRTELSHINLRKGDSVTLHCHGSGSPSPTITWTKQTGDMPNDEQSVVGTNLLIQHATRAHAGIYRCNADNGVGIPASKTIDVKVQYPPEIEVGRVWVYTGEGEEAVLDCIVHADPPIVKVKWFRHTMILDTDSRYLMEQKGSRYSLIIRNVQPSDFGNYSCEAYNQIGRAFKTIQLTGKPSRPIFRSDPVGRMQTTFNITWTVDTFYPVHEYRLSYRRKHLNSSEDSPGLWVNVVLPATLTDTENTSFHKRNDQHSSAQMSKIKSGKSYLVRNLKPGVVYEAKVVAKNKYGWGQPSELFEFSTSDTSQFPFDFYPQQDIFLGKDQHVISTKSGAMRLKSSEKILCSLFCIFMSTFCFIS